MIIQLVLRSPAAQWNVAVLARLLKVLKRVKRGLQIGGALFVLMMLAQLLYPTQHARPFVRLDDQAIGTWSQDKLMTYTQLIPGKPYQLAISGKTYKYTSGSLGIGVNTITTSSVAANYSLADRLIPFSLFSRHNYVDAKAVDVAMLTTKLNDFATARAEDPQDATIAKQGEDYSDVLPGKAGYVVDQAALKAQLVATAVGSHISVPRKAVTPKITQLMLENALTSWKRQTAQPITLELGTHPLVIPTSTLQTWTLVVPNQAADEVLISYDTAAIKNWLNTQAPQVYVAPKNATNYLTDGAISDAIAGANGTQLDVDTTAYALTSAIKTQNHSVNATLEPVPFTTATIKGYSPTSYGIQLLINDWAAKYASKSVAVSFQEIGGQGRTASFNSTQQFFTASIYKLFVESYTYHLLETGQLNPNSLVLGTGKSVSACLSATIIVSDNDCPLDLGAQLGWVNIQAYARQQGFNATTMINANWSTDTQDVTSYLSKLNAGTLMNAGDTAQLLGNMQNQIFRSAIPAGSPGSTVQDKVGFYNSYWHDAAIVYGPNATYILVVFTNGPGAGAIKDLAQQIQQTLGE